MKSVEGGISYSGRGQMRWVGSIVGVGVSCVGRAADEVGGVSCSGWGKL